MDSRPTPVADLPPEEQEAIAQAEAEAIPFGNKETQTPTRLRSSLLMMSSSAITTMRMKRSLELHCANMALTA